MPNKKTSSKDRGIRNMPEDTKMFNNDREGQKSKKGNNSIYLGLDYNDEFLQPKNYFWTREHNTIPIQGHFKGSCAFLCLSGPSFKNILVDHKDRLDRVFTMSTNNSIKSYRTDSWISVDDPQRFLKSIWMDPKIMKFVPIGHQEKTLWDSYNDKPLKVKTGECPNMYYFKRNNKFVASRWLTEASINWGNHEDHGGGRSVFIAALRILYILGFRKVFLLGCDFKMDANHKYHFEEERSKGAINCNNNTYKRMNKEYFPQLKPYFEKAGYEVYNCYKDSGLTVFPYMSFDDAYLIATDNIGNTEKESTLGMYLPPEEKSKKARTISNIGVKIREDAHKGIKDFITPEKDKSTNESGSGIRRERHCSIDYVIKNTKKLEFWKFTEDGNKYLISEEEYNKLIDLGVRNGK